MENRWSVHAIVQSFADPSSNFPRQSHRASRTPASASSMPPPPPLASFHGFARECLPGRPKSKGDEGLERGVGRLTRQVGAKLGEWGGRCSPMLNRTFYYDNEEKFGTNVSEIANIALFLPFRLNNSSFDRASFNGKWIDTTNEQFEQ